MHVSELLQTPLMVEQAVLMTTRLHQ